MRQIIKFLLATASVVALAGCGSSNSSSSHASSSAATAPVSSASFVAAASAICAKVDRDVAALPAIRTSADLLTTGAQELSVTSAAIVKLRTVTPPAGEAALFASYTGGLSQEEAQLQRVLGAIRANDTKRAEQIANQSKTLGLADNAKAKRLGLPVCAANATPSGTSTSSG